MRKFLLKFKKSRRNGEKGFTLLETLVAIAVFTFSIMGPLSLASYAIRSVSVARNQTIAFYLAEEAVEYIRNKRDSNSLVGDPWLKNLNQCWGGQGCEIDVPNDDISPYGGSGSYLRYNPVTGFYNYESGTRTTFKRRVKIDRNVGGRDFETRITVTLTWLERQTTKTFVVQENIFDWK